MGVLVQVTASVLLCFTCMNVGIFWTWPSSTILLFKSENTTLERSMTDIEISLFSSLSILGTFVGNPIVIACCLDRLGRKYTAIVASSLFVIAWSIIAFAKKVEAILAAMFIGGMGFTAILVVAVYISEIAQNSIRGTLTSGPGLFCALGRLVSYFLGGALEYHMMVYTCLLLAIIGVLVVLVLKESPVTLIVKRRKEEAAKSLAFYRRTGYTSSEVMTELNNIRRLVHSDLQDAQSSLTNGPEKVRRESETTNMSCWQVFKTSPSTRRQFCLLLALNCTYVIQGLPLVIVYAKPLFAAIVGDSISPNLCSVLFGSVSLIACIMAAYFIDKFGRRPLQIHSSIVSSICCLVLGTQILTEWFPKWTIPFLICVFAMSHTLGSGTVPSVIGAEIFLPEVKSMLLMLGAEWFLLCDFTCLFLFNIFIQSTGYSPVFYLFSVTCFATTVYVFYYLPETKGLPAHVIQALFMKNRDK